MSNTIPFRQSEHRRVRKPISIASLITGGLALVFALTGFAAQPGSARDQIEDLVVCYARGTDTLGRAVDAVGGQPLDSTVNLSDPVFAAGLAIYRECFADDFSFTLAIDGTPLLTVPNPATVTPNTDAALEWANFVNNSFRSSGYRNTNITWAASAVRSMATKGRSCLISSPRTHMARLAR